jgi:peptidoglycan/LPS O-acetylase OafA/YrhL
MNRERALKVVMVLVGLLFAAAIYPTVMPLWHPSPSDDTGDTMMMSLYFTLGVFLLVAARKPSAHRSLIEFTAWSSFAHAVVMTILGFHIPSEKVGFLIGSAVLVVIGVALLALAPPKQSVEQASAAAA